MLAIREMHIQTTRSYHYIPLRMGKKKKSDPCHQMLVWLWKNWSTHTLLVEMSNGTATLEIVW